MGTLAYTTIVDGEITLEMLGAILLSDDFDSFIITLPENQELEISMEKRISAPASSYEEAKTIEENTIR